MKKTANARFSIKSWEEKPYSEDNDLPKMTRASSTRRSPAISTAKVMSNT